MRKLLISLLLASAAATPALADPPKSDREQAREERQQAREQRQQSREQSRSERSGGNAPQGGVDHPQSGGSGHAERVSLQGGTDRAQFTGGRPSHVSVPEQGLTGGVSERAKARPGRQHRAESRRTDSDYVAPGPKIVRPQAKSLRESRSDRREQLRQDRIEARELRQSTRPLPPVMRTRTPVVSNVPREGTQPPPRVDNRRSNTPTWSTGWRHNNKYDWYNWRKRHRSRFHLGFYYDPFGWGYSPYQIGWRLWPSYYGSRYWLNDPWQYRLPYAPPGYRWIRYWDDAILVDTWSGQVVDVIHNFFW